MSEFLYNPTTVRSVLLMIHTAAAAFTLLLPSFTVVTAVGVNYGMVANNLPTPPEVVTGLKSRPQIDSVRLFDPNPAALKALEGSGIGVSLGTFGEDLPRLAVEPAFATSWVATNVLHYAPKIKFLCIAAGNEVISSNLASSVLPAIKNLAAALKAANLSTTVHMQILGESFPHSKGSFSAEAAAFMGPLAAHLQSTGASLLLNVYPYFPHAADPINIKRDYALFKSTQAVVIDGQLQYFNLFDAMVDAVHLALEKVGVQSVNIVVSETGWPSAGNGDIATVENARTYVNNLLNHLPKGTLKRPNKYIRAYVFALFKNQKPAGTEQHFGLYYPNKTELYHVDFPFFFFLK